MSRSRFSIKSSAVYIPSATKKKKTTMIPAHRDLARKKKSKLHRTRVRTIQHSKGTEINWRERKNGGRETRTTDVHKDASSEIGVGSGPFSL